jgi:ATP-binding cassette subfamily B protein
MEDGRIVERGTHAALMAAGGVYYEMVQRQMQSQEAGGEQVLR